MARKSLISDGDWADLEAEYRISGGPGCRRLLQERGLNLKISTLREHMSSKGIVSGAKAGDSGTSVASEAEPLTEEDVRSSVQSDIVYRRLKSEADLWHRKYNEALRRRAMEDEILDLMRAFQNVIQVPKLRPWNTEAPKRVKTTETMCAILTDWHAGERVFGEAMHGANAYDDQVFLARSEEFVKRFLDITFEKLAGYKFEEVRLYVTGDLINGMFAVMHDELIITQAMSLMTSYYGATLVLVQIIVRLLEFFERVHVCAAPGNHGRMTRKPMAKMPEMNWDMMIPKAASSFFRGDSRVTWNIPDSFFFIDEVQHQKILGLHGHQVRGWASIPWYGINKTVGNLTDMIDQQSMRRLEGLARSGDLDLTDEAVRGDLRSIRINHVVMGHFHTEAIFDRGFDGEVVAGPCMKGADEFTLSAGFRPAGAGQTIFGIHPDNGITHRWRINLQDTYEPTGDFEWVLPGDVPSESFERAAHRLGYS